MFAMPKAVRQTMKTQAEIATQVGGHALEWQIDAVKLAQKQIEANLETTRAVLEMNARAWKAMQTAWLAGFAEAPQTPAAS